jgi:transcription elongation factor Elf1
MEQLIINKYISNTSIESLSKEFKMGKIKIKKILIDNNIPIKSKGGQIKYHNTTPIKKEYLNKNLSCKSCGKIYEDVENKSGGITNHIKSCFPSEDIPSSFKRRMYLKETGEYWHFKFFDLINKNKDVKINCSECGWETKDIKNITGSLSKHIEKNHGTINDYIEKHPDQIHLFTTISKSIEKNELFNNNDNFITCEICGEDFKTISNTHLKLHNITTQEYKLKYGENSLISENTKKEFITNLSKCDNNFYYRSKSEKEIEEFIKSLGVNVKVCDKKQLNGFE